MFSQIKSEDLVSEAIKREKDTETKSDAKKVSKFLFLKTAFVIKLPSQTGAMTK